MASFISFLHQYFFLLVIHFALLLVPSISHGPSTDHSKNRSALFVFGDSIFDPGNNNFINTTTNFQANFLPYGETFFNYPTGRFSDGRLIPDFIAEYANLPYLPPYEEPGLHQFTYGVNFASGGAGALVQTHQGRVIDLKTQLNNFKNSKKLLEMMLGDKEARKLVSRAVYLFSIASNDYLFPIIQNSTIFKSYSQEVYVEMVIGNITDVIKEIYKSGGRKFGFLSLGPLGCLPSTRNLANSNGACMRKATVLVKRHNVALSKILRKLESHLKGFKYSNFNSYTSWLERIDNPSKYGFQEGKNACCGSGPYRGVSSCGGRREVKEYQLCSNSSEYVFFDSGHPTEMANQQLAKLMWSGTPKLVKPYNLKALFEQE